MLKIFRINLYLTSVMALFYYFQRSKWTHGMLNKSIMFLVLILANTALAKPSTPNIDICLADNILDYIIPDEGMSTLDGKSTSKKYIMYGSMLAAGIGTGATLGSFGAFVALLGFGSPGIVASTTAASAMSAAWTSGVGTALVSAAQSAGALFMNAAGGSMVAAAGAAVAPVAAAAAAGAAVYMYFNPSAMNSTMEKAGVAMNKTREYANIVGGAAKEVGKKGLEIGVEAAKKGLEIGKETLKMTNKYGKKAVKHAKKYGKKAVKQAKKYRKKAVKQAKKYRKKAVKQAKRTFRNVKKAWKQFMSD